MVLEDFQLRHSRGSSEDIGSVSQKGLCFAQSAATIHQLYQSGVKENSRPSRSQLSRLDDCDDSD